MSEDEIREHAKRIARSALRDLPFSDVYEDEQISDVSDEDLDAIFSLVTSATVVLPGEA